MSSPKPAVTVVIPHLLGSALGVPREVSSAIRGCAAFEIIRDGQWIVCCRPMWSTAFQAAPARGATAWAWSGAQPRSRIGGGQYLVLHRCGLPRRLPLVGTSAAFAHIGAAGMVFSGDVRIWRDDTTKFSAIEAYESVFAYRFKMYIEKQGYSGTGNLAVRREDFEKVGPFRGLDVAEDVD